MFLPSYRYTPVITEGLADLERLRAKVTRLAGDLEAREAARRRVLVARVVGALRLDGIAVPVAEAAAVLAGRDAALAPAARLGIQGYAFALRQIESDWPAERAPEAPPVVAGLHFFVTHDPARRGPPPGLRRTPGTVVDVRDGRAIAEAPAPAAIRPALQDLTGWLHAARSAVAPAIRAGVAYWRLLLIHPQQEANARTACAYTALLLHRADLLPAGLPAFEAAFAADLDRYYAALLAAGAPADGAPPELTPWLEYFIGALRDALRGAAALLQPVEPPAPAPVTRLNPRQRQILALLAAPGASLANQECQQLFAVSPVTAARDFRELVELGLVEMHGQGRATYYVMRNA